MKGVILKGMGCKERFTHSWIPIAMRPNNVIHNAAVNLLMDLYAYAEIDILDSLRCIEGGSGGTSILMIRRR
jgi:hypothetical protein